MMQDDNDDDDDDYNDDPMILNNRAKNHTSERTIVPWTVIFILNLFRYPQIYSLSSNLLVILKSVLFLPPTMNSIHSKSNV